MMRLMTKLLMAVATLATFAGTSSATFTVTFGGLPAPSSVLTNATVPGTYQASGSNGLLTYNVNSSATQSSTNAALSSSFSLTNLSSSTLAGPFTVTISQDAYALPGGSRNAAGTFTATATGGTIGVPGGTVSYSTTVDGGPAFFTHPSTFVVSGAAPTGSAGTAVVNAANPFSQTFTISGLAANGTIELAGTTQVQLSGGAVITPVPSTLLAAVAGLPLLGFAGMLRRRVVGM